MQEVIEEEKIYRFKQLISQEIQLIFGFKKSFDVYKHRYNIPMCNEVCHVVVTDCE